MIKDDGPMIKTWFLDICSVMTKGLLLLFLLSGLLTIAFPSWAIGSEPGQLHEDTKTLKGRVQSEVVSKTETFNLAGVSDEHSVSPAFGMAEFWLQKTANPLILCLILAVGLIGLFVEWRVFGLGVGGLIALMSFSFIFWRSQMIGHGHWEAWALLTAGVIGTLIFFFIKKLRFFIIIPSQLMFLTGIYLLLAGPWHFATASDHLGAAYTMAGALFFTGVGILVVSTYVPATIKSGKIFFWLALTRRAQEMVDSEDKTPLSVGDQGVAITDMSPQGMVRFVGLREPAYSDEGYIRAGTRVVIVSDSDDGWRVKPYHFL